jgi:tetratricopeptide (TPR) repeat protein
MARFVVAFIGLTIFASSRVGSQHTVHQIPVIPTTLLDRPLPLRAGIGTAHDAVTTSSREAQQYYDQGLAYLHNYVWIEAARSFHQALRLDPRLAMAHVGLSYAFTELNQRTSARQAIDRARKLAAGVSEHERSHLDVRERQMAAEEAPRDDARRDAFRRRLDEALQKFPDDAELWVLRGIAESPDPADRGQGSPITAVPFYERALTLVATHFGARHYLAHAAENRGHIADALTHSSAYATLASNVPHARHMRGHALRRLGRIQEAIAEFEAADRLEQRYFATEKIPAEYDWHHEHNLGLLATSYQYAGQIKKAEALFQRAFALPTAHLVQAVNKREWPMFLRSRGRHDEAMGAAKLLIDHPNPIVQAIGHIETGHVHLAQRRFSAAADEANAALAVLKKAAGGQGLAAVHLEALQGEFLLRTGQSAKGRAMLDSAVKKIRGARGPDEWVQALFTLEGLARAARDAGDWSLAARMAQQMLDHDAAYGGTHYALALVADQRGDRRAAAAEFVIAGESWQNADPDLAELIHLRKWGVGSRE